MWELTTPKLIRQNTQELMHITWFISYNKYSNSWGPIQRKDDVASEQEIPLLRWAGVKTMDVLLPDGTRN